MTELQQQLFKASDGGDGDSFGEIVLLSQDSKTAFISAPEHKGESGAVYIFEKNGSAWVEQQKLYPDSIQKGERFGGALILSENEEYLFVSAPYKNNNQGAVYIFQKHSGGIFAKTKWKLKQTLEAQDGAAGDYFGEHIAWADKGETLIVGAHAAFNNNSNGAVYIYSASGKSFSFVQKLTMDNGDTNFGQAIKISQTGDAVFVSTLYSVYLFIKNGNNWEFAEKLVEDSHEGSISITPDANTVLLPVSEEYNADIAHFQRDGKQWRKIEDSVFSGRYAKPFIAINTASDTIIVGDTGENQFYNYNTDNRLYFFQKRGDDWHKVQEIKGEPYEMIGDSVVLSDDGKTAIITKGIREDDSKRDPFLVFKEKDGKWMQAHKQYTEEGCARSGYYGSQIALSADGTTVLLGGYGENYKGLVVVFDMSKL